MSMWTPSLKNELKLLLVQYLDEENYEETLHKFEQESRLFFNINYFEEKITAGDWDEAERYLSGFTKIDENRYSIKLFFEIRKQKYREALDKKDMAKAVEILRSELKVFSTWSPDLYNDLTQLITLDNYRESEKCSAYGDAKTARNNLIIRLRKLIEANPVLLDKLDFPVMKKSRLRALINQSLNLQHSVCKYPKEELGDLTLYTDHTCDAGPATTPVPPLAAAVAESATCAPVVSQPSPTAANAKALVCRRANATVPSFVQPAVVVNALPEPTLANQGQCLQPFPPAATAPNAFPSVDQAAFVTALPTPTLSNQVSMLKHPRTPQNAFSYQNTEHGQLMKRLRSSGQAFTDQAAYPTDRKPQWTDDDLPKTVVGTFHLDSYVTSLDFHPSHHTLVLAGSAEGEIALWEIRLRERLVSKSFKIQNMAACSASCKASFGKDPSVSITRVTWSPAGNLIGVAYTKHLIHLYGFQGTSDLQQHLEIDAHTGSVNDLAFAQTNEQLWVVSCGDDKQINVWDLSGQKMYNFDGHDAPVYSVCPHQRANISYILSATTDGKIKTWLYDSLGSGVTYNASGHACTKLMYCADGTRLFSCGTTDEGLSFLVEWNETDRVTKRIYFGFSRKSADVVQFDTTQNIFLAAGEDHLVKFWNMNDSRILCSTEAGGGLPSCPHLRFNKEGNLLAVSTMDNGFKILANLEGQRCLKILERPSFEGLRGYNDSAGIKIPGPSAVINVNPAVSKVPGPSAVINVNPAISKIGVDNPALPAEKPRDLEHVTNESRELVEIVVLSKCRVTALPDSTDHFSKVARLLYTNSGNGILVVGSNGIQRIWKWNQTEENPNGKATASVVPQHWQPKSGLHMINDVSDNLEIAVPCIALSKNDCFVVSACGGKISLFNMMSFKVLTTFVLPPLAPTFLVFHPQNNNVVAIGMDDSTIYIYNAREGEVKTILKGHQERITGLAFSTNLNVLVSSGADAQLCRWNIDTWEKQKAITIQVPSGKVAVGDTRVQFHSDQIRLLVSDETQLSIYDASTMKCIHKWDAREELSTQIAYAAYSCNSQLIYAAFHDGNIGVFDNESLRLTCRIAPLAYLSDELLNRRHLPIRRRPLKRIPSASRSQSPNVRPVFIATHPQEPNQLAIGLTDGTVKVLEPSESDGEWLVRPARQNRVTVCTASKTPEQLQR